MSEGRNQLEQAIEAWQERHEVAVLAQREADIVLPFLRAAVEELHAFRKNGEQADGASQAIEPLRAPQSVNVERKPTFSAHRPEVELEPAEVNETPTPFRGKKNADEAGNGLVATIAADQDAEESYESISSGFGRKSIATLIQEAGNKEEAAS